MTIRDAFSKVKSIQIKQDSPEVIKTVISLINNINPRVTTVQTTTLNQQSGALTIAIVPADKIDSLHISRLENPPERFVYFDISADGTGWLICSHTNFIYAYIRGILDNKLDADITEYGKVITPTFQWQRLNYDTFLTQQDRIQRGFHPDTYIEQAARLGFTHMEVNGLAWPMGMERGVKGETYAMFYTYCPALDQFVYSKLNKGLYPYYFLSANMNYMKTNARLAVKYGLTPGMLSFEPRDVPEEFFSRYPMLRGARVDHPFRSFKPRYNMTTTHPLVLEHYAEMMSKIMTEIPELGYITVWSNDSGAGFEHTKSLYVGRNGGAYMIREWKSDDEIARLAGENVIRFLSTLRDAAKTTNPDFRVITRMESLYGEHDTVFNALGDQLDIETTSLAARGWAMPYTHPRYSDSQEIIGGSVYQQQFDEAELAPIEQLRSQGSIPHYNFAAGPHVMFDPLMGIPTPKLVYKRLKMLANNGIDSLSHQGGTFPPELVPFNISHEICREFQFNQEMDIDVTIQHYAKKWAGENYADALINAWEHVEQAVINFPNVSGMYTTYGFSWYRLWARPFVPNIEAIPAEERAYYEEFMCTTAHNPNNIDLSRDVLFMLTTPEKSEKALQRIDENVWQPINAAIETLAAIQSKADAELGEGNAITDQLIRFRAFRCWLMTQRNIAAWVTGVYGYMNAENEAQKQQSKALITELIEKEIQNTKDLAALLETGVPFMSQTDMGETPLMYGANLIKLLPKRIALMQKHINDEPFIDPDYIERKAAEPII